jgi:transposase-like protein
MAGTIFQDTHQPLKIWFRIIWAIVSQKFGANALGLSRTLGIGYSTTWHLLHKLRRAMVRPGREKLTGRVEVDETYIGGNAEAFHGRGADKKVLVVMAVELKGKETGRVRMRALDRATEENLTGFIKDNVEPGSTVITDDGSVYSRLDKLGYVHEIGTVKKGQEALPNAHRTFTLVKRWLLGTYQGTVERKNFEHYLDEYAFRYNRRKARSPGVLFRRLIEQAVVTEPVTRKGLVHGRPDPENNS